jgi:uncharacterized protein YbjQ (UPF0145 family)
MPNARVGRVRRRRIRQAFLVFGKNKFVDKVSQLEMPTAAPDAQVETQTTCCCCTVPVEVTVTDEGVGLDSSCFERTDIYISTLGDIKMPGATIKRELGCVTATVLKQRGHAGGGGMAGMYAAELAEAEKCRALAISKLRLKAGNAGGNAILGLKLDLESALFNSSIVVANGTAVEVDWGAGAGWTNESTPLYLPGSYGSTVNPVIATATPMEMTR